MVAALCFAQACRLKFGMVGMSVLRGRIIVLLLSYAAATGIGGAVHQWYDGRVDSLNSIGFRVAWTIVVSLTCLGGAAIGLVGSEIASLGVAFRCNSNVGPFQVLSDNYELSPLASTIRRRQIRSENKDAIIKDKKVFESAEKHSAESSIPESLKKLPAVPPISEAAWLLWGGVLVGLVGAGMFSCLRPAADVFIAGCSQTLPTFYLQLALLSITERAPRRAWWSLQVSLIGNAPLIFAYPWLVQQSGLTLGTINAALHAVLALSWGIQGCTLGRICSALETSEAKKLSPQLLVDTMVLGG